MIDATMDFYIIATYYESGELIVQARALLEMIVLNLTIQVLAVLANYHAKSWSVKVRETLIFLFFLRPVVDAYRVGMSLEDDEHIMSRLR